MIMNPLFSLRLTVLFGSVIVDLLASDPRDFVRKVSERLRTSRLPHRLIPWGLLRHYSDGEKSEARKLVQAGHLTAGVNLVLEQGKTAATAEIRLAKRTVRRIEQLEAPVVPSPPRTSVPDYRVLHLLTNSEPFTNSGYTVRSRHVLECQQKESVAVHAVTRLGYPVLVGKLPQSVQQSIDGITYRRLLPWFFSPRLQRRTDKAVQMLVAEARAFGATILHTTTDYTNALVVAEAARRLNIPWVYEVRGELESTWAARQPVEKRADAENSEFYRLARRQETCCMQAAAAVIALSEVSKQQMIIRGVPAEKITVVPNAVNEDEIGRTFDKEEIRRELGLDVHQKLVGTVTAVVDYEGLDTLVEALAHLPEDFSVLIVGEGTARPGLEQRVAELGLTDRAIFAGRQPNENIWRWYAALDVFVVPRKDTEVTRNVTPIKPLMAMALDIPVVTSDLPALREVTGGRATYVVAGEPELLAKEVQAVVGTRQGGPDWARQRTWQANGRRYRGVYNRLLDGSR